MQQLLVVTTGEMQMNDDASSPQKAFAALSMDLFEEVFEDADRYLRADGTLHHYEIFRWLVNTQETQGLVSEATLGTAGSRWLLARTLSDTLQDVVNHIVVYAAAEKALQSAIEVFAFANVMQIWRMNDGAQEGTPMYEVLNPEQTQGFE